MNGDVARVHHTPTYSTRTCTIGTCNAEIFTQFGNKYTTTKTTTTSNDAVAHQQCCPSHPHKRQKHKNVLLYYGQTPWHSLFTILPTIQFTYGDGNFVTEFNTFPSLFQNRKFLSIFFAFAFSIRAFECVNL